jgi:hypothetical protein
MIIDSHVHAGHADGLANSWDTFEDINLSLRRMDEVGIDKAVVLPIGSGNFQRANREVAEIVKQHAGRLYGYAKVSQTEDAGRVDQMLHEAFEKLHLRGLKLHGHPNREIMEAMNRHRKPVLVDCFGEVYGLRYVAGEYPQVPIIIAHMGKFLSCQGQVRALVLFLAKEFPNVYFDTSSVCDHEWLERAAAEGLCAKMIFGSDGPGLHCGVELARIRYLKLPPQDEELVLWKNIAGLLGLERP